MNIFMGSLWDEDECPKCFGTLSGAHAYIKATLPHAVADARIDMFSVPTDTAGILTLLNFGGIDPVNNPPKRTWGMTPRRALRELKPGE